MMAYGDMPFPETGCPLPDVYIYYVSGMINVWETISTFIHPLDVSAHGHSFWTTDWIIYNGPPLYQIYILISRRVPGVEAGITSGVWGCG